MRCRCLDVSDGARLGLNEQRDSRAAAAAQRLEIRSSGERHESEGTRTKTLQQTRLYCQLLASDGRTPSSPLSLLFGGRKETCPPKCSAFSKKYQTARTGNVQPTACYNATNRPVGVSHRSAVA